jgi:hypothetical protein
MYCLFNAICELNDNFSKASNDEVIHMDASKHLKRRFITALIALLIALLAALAATFAWYIYNTNAHTTNVKMAAGTSASLQISNTYNGTYGSAAVLDAFTGTLNPVSTNRIAGGFQKVYGFSNGSENQSKLVASIFGSGDASDYYKTTLYLRTNGETMKVYLADIGYEDSDSLNPISTAIRVGLVPHEAGQNKAASGEYIFAINTGDNPEADYNTASGQEGYVLDAAKTDGTTVAFTPYTSDNYCNYDRATGAVTLNHQSVQLCTVSGDGSGAYGTAVQLDIYIWLEGCDKDCTMNLCATTLKNLSLSFAGVTE